MKTKKSRLEVLLTLIIVGGLMGCTQIPETLPYYDEGGGAKQNEVATKSDDVFTTEDPYTTICPYCGFLVLNCVCERCPRCGHTADKCYCPLPTPCPECGQVGGMCNCHNICQGCFKPTFECECPPSSTDPAKCPICGNSHSSTESCSIGDPICHCGSALCNGTPELCNCKDQSYCKYNDNCICTGEHLAKTE